MRVTELPVELPVALRRPDARTESPTESRTRPGEWPFGPPGAAPRVSVVIPTCGRPALLLRCLRALCGQTLPHADFEVLVVDDGHSDDTRHAVVALSMAMPPIRLRYLRPPSGKGPAVARNHGWRHARADLVAFTDDDTVPARDWLAEGLAAMQASGLPAMAGRVVVPRAAGRAPTDHERMTLGLEHTEFVTANAFVRRRALTAVCGFDERFLRPWREDSDLQFRIERELGPVGRCEQALVEHPVRAEGFAVSLRQQKNVLYDALLYRKHPKAYRERIRRVPPLDYYAIVLLAFAAVAMGAAGALRGAGVSLALAALLVLRLAARRLHGALLSARHVAEMLWTSALIPFASVYWRMRGAWRYRVWFL